jgi:uncharacterized damage-inducible protein DinB
MTTLELQLIEAWQIHNRITLFMIEQIPDEALNATLSKRGGRDIARQLAHVQNVRFWRLDSFRKKSGMKLIEFEKDESPNKEKLLEAFKQSGMVMEKYIEHCLANGGAVSNFKRGVIPMVGYYISHEAHHRGGILLTMKQSGFPLPESLRFGIWDWNKI